MLVPGVGAGDQLQPSGEVTGLGQVMFPTSCSAEVREDFNRAVAMLHSFWYPESERAFRAITEKDPACGMAYWGIAMSRFHELWERPGEEDLKVGSAALEKAKSAGEKSEKELGYINALEQFYNGADTRDHLSRMVAYENAMGDLRKRFMDDTEVSVFYSLAMLGAAYSSPPDKTYARQKKAGAILEDIFKTKPDHPGVVHYIIHSYDYPPLAGRALEAARRYAKIAPEAPHALHMPSHIFTRLGLWQESISSNLAAAAAARKGHWTGEEMHATDYLTYAYLQGAQDDQAKEILKMLPAQMSELRRGAVSNFAGLYAAGAIPARYTLERREWMEAARLSVPENFFPDGSSCWAEATLFYARGLGASRTGNFADARNAVQELENCRKMLLQTNEQLWAKQVEVQLESVKAWLAYAEGKKTDASAMMRRAADLEDATDKHPVTPGAVVPARELLGEMLLELNRPDEAFVEFEKTLQNAPNRFRSLYGAALAAERSGKSDVASNFYTKLMENCSSASSERAELGQARNFIRAHANP